MPIELAVLDRFERIHEEGRDRIRFDEQPVFVMGGEDAPKADRLEAQQRRALAVGSLEHAQPAVAEIQGIPGCRIEPIPEPEGPRPQRDPARFDAVLPRASDIDDLLKAQLIERRRQPACIERHAGVELERRRVDAGRDIPAPVLELADHADTDDEHVEQHRAKDNHGDRPLGRPEECLFQLFYLQRLSPWSRTAIIRISGMGLARQPSRCTLNMDFALTTMRGANLTARDHCLYCAYSGTPAAR